MQYVHVCTCTCMYCLVVHESWHCDVSVYIVVIELLIGFGDVVVLQNRCSGLHPDNYNHIKISLTVPLLMSAHVHCVSLLYFYLSLLLGIL